MLPRIDAIQGFERRLAGVDRVRQRIAEIENKFGIDGAYNGEDFQSILNRELGKVQNVNSTQRISKPEKTEATTNPQTTTSSGTNSEVESFGATGESEGTTRNNSRANNSSSAAATSSNSRTFPGEEALPGAIQNSINPFSAVSPRTSTTQPERVDEEEIETPTRETRRLSSISENVSTEDLIEAAAAKYDVDSRLVRAVAIAESNMNQDDISDAGAIGVMQLMPETAASLGVNPYDEQQNIEGGARYLRQMLDTFGGNVRNAVAAYNAGPGAVQRYGGIPPYSETQNYVGRVMDLYR